jgi:hypothetical protein
MPVIHSDPDTMIHTGSVTPDVTDPVWITKKG